METTTTPNQGGIDFSKLGVPKRMTTTQDEGYDTGDWDFGTIAEWDNPQSKQRELPPE